jgi:hypothetical protein
MEKDNLAPELQAHLIEDQDLIIRVRTASVPRIGVRHYPDRRTAIAALDRRLQN